jgi:tripartite-type tricarboxylate transporter receptor subunit TctC
MAKFPNVRWLARTGLAGGVAFGLCVGLLAPTATRADPVADFYAGRTIYALVGLSAGGGNDRHMRLVARHIGRFIPGHPTVVPQNMVGADGLVLANYLYKVAPKDGTYFALLSNSLLGRQAVDAESLQYDVAKYNWLGSVSPRTVQVVVVSKSTGVNTIEDAMKKQVVLGSVGNGSTTSAFPRLLNDLLGTKFKVVEGYPGSPPLDLAIERHEVDGRHYTWTGLQANKPQWLAKGEVSLLLYSGEKPDDLNGVPSLDSLIKNDADREVAQVVNAGTQLGYPFATTPDAPKDRLAALRSAFEAMYNDPEFRKEAKKARVELGLLRHTDLEKIIQKVLAEPADVRARAKRYMQ